MRDTRDEGYSHRLIAKQDLWWKRLLNVQAPYRWNLRRLRLGRTLDVGCGIGRNLVSLEEGSVGVDHNESSVAEARRRGLVALTVDEWLDSPHRVPGSFDSLLFAHVIEHLVERDAVEVLGMYLPYVKPGGHVLFVCPQERGYATDSTHVRFVDSAGLTALAEENGLFVQRAFSFPLPRRFGKLFTYNEFCVLAVKPAPLM